MGLPQGIDPSIEHRIRRKLHQCGVSPEQLKQIRFWPTNLHNAEFDQWAFTYPAGAPLASLSYMKPYCAAVEVLGSADSAYDNYRAAAWRCVSDALSADMRFVAVADARLSPEHRAVQQFHARMPRSLLTTDGITLFQAINSFASFPENVDLSAKLLWRKFEPELRLYGLNPQIDRKTDSICYSAPRQGKSRRLTFKTFQNHLSQARNESR